MEETIDVLRVTIASLEAELVIYKNKKDSNNSHTPPSQDQNRPKRNQSLRVKSGKKPGGQPGHPGATLEMNMPADIAVEHMPNYCNNCGSDLSDVEQIMVEERKVIDIPVVQPVYTQHRIYRKVCSCGFCTQSEFPADVAASLQYGPRVEALVGYLHTRQYLPYQRMKELFKDVMGLPISVGGIGNVLARLARKAQPYYEQIKTRLLHSAFVGTDETSVRVNGNKNWIWTWQNDNLTFIVHSNNRAGRTIETQFPDGLPHTGLVHDRYRCHFNCDAAFHQICMAHLLRDIKYITQIYEGTCEWALQLNALILHALDLKRSMEPVHYLQPHEKRDDLVKKLGQLLNSPIDKKHTKAKTLCKDLLKHQNSILNFLWHQSLPPDNNGSERAIRNVKVKQKVSGHFKSDRGAEDFAVLRSLIDTTNKSDQKILNALYLIARNGAE